MRGRVSNEDTHTQSHLVPVLSTSPIDYYYDGGTVRVNTEFYSWDTSFGLVNPRLRHSVCKLCSASTLVPFLSASCSWDGGSRASAQLKLNVP
jgi:hypothetical protein